MFFQGEQRYKQGVTMIVDGTTTRHDVNRRTLELKEACAETEQLLRAITSILISLDEEDRIVQWNAATEKVFGISKAEVMGRTLRECNIQWDCDKIIEAVNVCKNQKKTIPADDVKFKRLEGTDGFLGLTVIPIIAEETERLGILVLGADITDRKMLEAQLGAAQKLEAIGQLAAGIAHEINTPTQYVGDNTKFLKDSFENFIILLEKYKRLLNAAEENAAESELVSEIKEFLEAIDIDYMVREIPIAIQQSLEGVERVTSIVQAMKEFAHPGSKEKIPIDINKAIKSTVTVARNEWKYVADMETDFASNMPRVCCLPGEFNQVILNIVVNAAQAISETIGDGSAEKGVISISTRKAGDWAEIRISDTGCGIPQEIREKIFDPFFTTKEVGAGTGQGLSIAYSIVVDKHKGTITFDSEVGKGTTFIIRLPVAISEEITQQTA
jgi:PAS domain S-box-containing protein